MASQPSKRDKIRELIARPARFFRTPSPSAADASHAATELPRVSTDSSLAHHGDQQLSPGLPLRIDVPQIGSNTNPADIATICPPRLSVPDAPRFSQNFTSQSNSGLSTTPPRSLTHLSPITQPRSLRISISETSPVTNPTKGQIGSEEHLPDISPNAPQTNDPMSAALKVSLRALKASINVIPSFKSAADLLVECINTIPIAVESHKEFAELACNIMLAIKTFEEHLSQPNPPQMSKAIMNTISGLREQAVHIKAQQVRSSPNRLLSSEEDIEDIVKGYRRVEALSRQLQNDAILSIWRITNESLSEVKESRNNAQLQGLNPSKKAQFDYEAAAHIRRRGCAPNTRRLVLQELQDWAGNPHGAKVYWMNGMAGTGKTTIAYSLCRQLEASGQLAASFFCSRSLPECRDVSRIVPTIAYQLARSCQPFHRVLCRALDSDPDIGIRSVTTQFEKLLAKPFQEIRGILPAGLLVVVIDALDECTDLDDTLLVLDSLRRFAKDLSIKFFVTCRPDGNLLSKISSSIETDASLHHLHDVEETLVQADIKTYLNDELRSIDATVDQINMLAERSGRLFIYAATAVRYIKVRTPAADRRKRLNVMLGMASVPTSTKAYEPLDALYTTILAAAINDPELESWEKKNVELVLHTVICAREPLGIDGLSWLLRLESPSQARQAIEPLRSVLHLDERTELVSTLHASFPDYMHAKNRSEQFFCDRSAHSCLLTLACFEVMKSSLRFNICDLDSSFTLDVNVPNLSSRINTAIPSHLYYACRYWSDHLNLAASASELLEALEEFLCHRVLFWVEVMNLKKSTRAGALMLSKAYRSLKGAGMLDNVCALCQDAQRFITIVGASPVRGSTPHICISVLALWDRRDPMWLYYGKQVQGLASPQGSAIDNRDSSVLSVWKAGSEVFSVAVSSDGKYVASGSLDGSMRIWDAHSGDIITGPLRGHTSGIGSVAFSPEGGHVVSGSDDHTILIWDLQSGNIAAGPFRGHKSWVRSVAYSPNGERIASGSNDCTIQIWNAQTGQMLVDPLTGHRAGICSLAYSPDGSRIVSGSADCTIRVWDAQSGYQMIHPLQGHTGHILSVTYSPDGDRIASGSSDRTIRVWDSETGNILGDSFKGHEDGVRSIAYSPDGDHIASGSFDYTIRVWDARTGQAVAGPLRAHTECIYAVVYTPNGDRITSGSGDATIRIWDARTRHIPSGLSDEPSGHIFSVAFSSDSSQIVSGSDDKTIYIWDAFTGRKVAGPFRGHAGAIFSVAFSPDSRHVLSGSADSTIRIWSVQSGATVKILKGHTNSVYSAAFSPDGTHVASGSNDRTIRVWDTYTGLTVANPQGHNRTVRSVSYSPDGLRIASGSNDCTIRVWDAKTGSLLAGPFTGHANWVTSVAYSPDGARIISGSQDCSIRVWDSQTGQPVANPFVGHTFSVISAAFLPNSSLIVSGSTDRTICIWDSHTGHALAGPFIGHITRVHTAACSPDGRLIASGSNDGAIRVWDSHKCCSTEHWVVNKSGWVTGRDSSLLLWVPLDLRATLKWPQNQAVIHRGGSFQLDFTDALMGSRWRECYKP